MAAPGQRSLDAATAYLLIAGGASFFFTLTFTVSSIYRVTVAGLNPLQLVLVGTVLELSVLLFEVPTGVVADVYSRRLSVIIGYCLIGAGLMLEALFPLFGTILLSQALWGIGYTFTSGAQQAWITDEVGEERAGPLFLRGNQVEQLLGFIAIFVSVGLASWQLNLPMILGGALMLALGLLLILIMPERGFAPTPHANRTSWQMMRETLASGLRTVRGRPLLWTILGITALWGMSSEGYDRLTAAHFLENISLPALGDLQPVVWFGIMAAGGRLLGIGATELVRQRVNTADYQSVGRALTIVTALLMVAVITFGLAGSFWLALAAYWGVGVLRQLNGPLALAWLNQQIAPQVRATVISMNGQADAFGQVIFGPLVGAVGTLASLRSALIVSGVALAPALLLYARALRPRQ